MRIRIIPGEYLSHPRSPAEIASLTIIIAADAADQRQKQEKVDDTVSDIDEAQIHAEREDEVKRYAGFERQQKPPEKHDPPGVILDRRLETGQFCVRHVAYNSVRQAPEQVIS